MVDHRLTLTIVEEPAVPGEIRVEAAQVERCRSHHMH